MDILDAIPRAAREKKKNLKKQLRAILRSITWTKKKIRKLEELSHLYDWQEKNLRHNNEKLVRFMQDAESIHKEQRQHADSGDGGMPYQIFVGLTSLSNGTVK